MSDCVVTVPKTFTHPDAPGKRGLAAWIAEGDAAGEPWSGQEWWFTTYGPIPVFTPDARLYIVCEGRLRGYAPITDVRYNPNRTRKGQAPIAFLRKGDAVAVTIEQNIVGFRGWRARWWDRSEEIVFPDWKDGGIAVINPHVGTQRGQTNGDENNFHHCGGCRDVQGGSANSQKVVRLGTPQRLLHPRNIRRAHSASVPRKVFDGAQHAGGRTVGGTRR